MSIVETGKVLEAVEVHTEKALSLREFYPLPKFGDSYTLIGSAGSSTICPPGLAYARIRRRSPGISSRFYPHISSNMIPPWPRWQCRGFSTTSTPQSCNRQSCSAIPSPSLPPE